MANIVITMSAAGRFKLVSNDESGKIGSEKLNKDSSIVSFELMADYVLLRVNGYHWELEPNTGTDYCKVDTVGGNAVGTIALIYSELETLFG